MGKDLNKKFTVNLEISTDEAEKQVKMSAENIKKILSNAVADGVDVKQLRNMAKTINSMFESIGKTAPLDIDKNFKYKGDAEERIKLLTDALANLSTVFNNVNNQTKGGLDIGGAGGGDNQIQGKIEELKSTASKYQQILDIFNGKYEKMKVSTTKKTEIQEVEKLIKLYKEARDTKDKFSTNTSSKEYQQAYSEQLRFAVLLKNTMDDISDNGSDAGAEFIAKKSNMDIYSSAEAFVESFETMSSKQLGPFKTLITDMLTDVKTNLATLESSASSSTNIIQNNFQDTAADIDKAVQKVKEFYRIIDAVNNKSFDTAEDNVAIGKYIERISAAKNELEDLAKQGLITADELKGIQDAYSTSKASLENNVSHYTGYGDGHYYYSYSSEYEAEKNKNAALEEENKDLKEQLAKMSTQSASTPDVVPASVDDSADTVVSAIDAAKAKIVAKWKEYYQAVEEAKNDGYEVEDGVFSPKMEDIQSEISDMYDQWDAKATKGIYKKKGPSYALDLSDYIIDGDVGFDDIEEEISMGFKTNGIEIGATLDEIMADMLQAEQQAESSTQEMASDLGDVEIKTNDVATAFQKLIGFISKSGSSPKGFFQSLMIGTQNLDDELKEVLTSLNLIDASGNANFTLPNGGFSNSGGLISDEHVLIARDKSKLQFSLAAKEKTSQAKAMGANVGAVLEVYETKDAIYELQNTVKGKGILDFKSGILNTEFLEATDDQVKKLIEDLLILQKTGLYVDWNGDNLLYDKEKGFSFIDFFTDSVTPYTVGKDNTVQENLDMLFSKMLSPNFYTSIGEATDISEFQKHVNSLVSEVKKQNDVQQDSVKMSQNVEDSMKLVTTALDQEETAHEQNTEAITAENKALQAQIELKKKAQSMKWKDFALDESLSGLIGDAGISGLSDLEYFWKQSNYDKKINYTAMSEEDAKAIIEKDSWINHLRSKWYSSEDFNAKGQLENAILEDDELRNAAMNSLYYRYVGWMNTKNSIHGNNIEPVLSFDDFLTTEFEVYRGDDAPKLFNENQKLSFSLNHSIAQSFDDNIQSAKVMPIETLGNVATKSYYNEAELWLPNEKLPYLNFSGQSFDDYYQNLDTYSQEYLDAILVQLEKKRVENLLDPELNKFKHLSSGVVDVLKKGNVPKTLQSTGDSDAEDQLVDAYNNLPEMQQKLLAYYYSLRDNDKAKSYVGSADYDSLGKQNIANAVMNDTFGLQQHVKGLTQESKFGLMPNNDQFVKKEIFAHQQNVQAIQKEVQEQQKLNNAKVQYAEVEHKLNTAILDTSDNIKAAELETILANVSDVRDTEKGYDGGAIAYGDYLDSTTGEVHNYAELSDMITDFEFKYNENLQYVKDYLHQVFAAYDASIDGLFDTTKGFELDDELLLDGFDINDYEDIIDSGHTYSESEMTQEHETQGDLDQKLQTEHEITSEKQQQAALDATLDVDHPSTDVVQVQDVQNETNSLDTLLLKINAVEQAVKDKTAAFENEGVVVDKVVAQEMSALYDLLDLLNQVINSIYNITDGLDNVSNTKLTNKDSDNNLPETPSDNAQTNVGDTTPSQDGYALNTTVIETNAILNNILAKMGSGDAFSGLVEPLKSAVDELKKVSQGIIEEHKAKKVDTSKADDRLADPKAVHDIEQAALNSVYGRVVDDGEYAVTGMTAMANGMVKVTGFIQTATDAWEGFTLQVDEAGKVSKIAYDKTAKVAKEAEKAAAAAAKAATEDNNPYVYDKAEVETRAQKHIDEYTAQGKQATVKFQDSGRYTITVLEEIDGLSKQIFQTFDENDKKIERTTATISNKQKIKLDNLKSTINAGVNSNFVGNNDSEYVKYNTAVTELEKMNALYRQRDDLSDDEILAWNQQIALVQQLGVAVEKLINKRKVATNDDIFKSDKNKKVGAFNLDKAKLEKSINIPESFKTKMSDAGEAIKNAADAESLKIAVNNWKALENEIKATAKAQDLYIKQEKKITGSAKKKEFGATATINASAKYQAIKNVVTDPNNRFSSSSIVQNKFDEYEAAYNHVIGLQKQLAKQDAVTQDQETEWKQATAACNKYGNELNRIITSSQKLSGQKLHQDYYLGSDFTDNKEGRIAALSEFAKSIYDVNVSVEDFKDNYTKCVFAVNNGNGTFTQMTAQLDDARTQVVALAGETKQVTSTIGAFWNELKGKFKSISAYLISSFSIQEVWQQVRRGVEYVREIDSALTELKKVTDETDASYDQFLQDMSRTAGVVGSTVSDLTTMSAEWARLGYSMEEAGKLAESTAILLNVSEFQDATTASEALISTMQAFSYTADESQHVVDILNEIGNNYAVSSDGLAVALQDSASALMEGGNNLEQAVALVAAANRVVKFVPRRYSNIATSR